MSSEMELSGRPSYVHSVHTPRTGLDTAKSQDGKRISNTMSSRPMRFAIVVTQDMFDADRPHVFHTVETKSHWTTGHSPQTPGAVGRKSVSSQNLPEWTLWTYLAEVIV